MAEKNASLNLNVTVGGVAKASAEMAKAEQAVKRLGDTTRKAAEAAKPVGAIRNLKGMFGEESTAGELLKMVRGAGAFAAVGMGVQLVGTAIRNVSEATKQWAQGTIDARSAIMRMAEGVPVLGQLVTAARNVGDAMGAIANRAETAREKVREVARQRFRAEAAEEGERAKREAGTQGTLDSFRERNLSADMARMTPRQRLAAESSREAAAFDEAIAAMRKSIEAEFGDLRTANIMRGAMSPERAGELDRQQDRLRKLESESTRAGGRAFQARGEIDAEELRNSNKLNTKIWDAIRGAGRTASTDVGRGVSRAGNMAGWAAWRVSQGGRVVSNEEERLEIDALRRGTALQKIEADRLEIKREFREEEKRLQAIIQNRGSSDEERNKAASTAAALRRLRDAEVAGAARREYSASPVIPFFDGSGGGGTLARTAAMERSAASAVTEGDKGIIAAVRELIEVMRGQDDTFR